MLKLYIISNSLQKLQIAESSGIDRFLVDLEVNGKRERQNGLDTLISNHTIDDVRLIANNRTSIELVVRVNPINKDSKKEIDDLINLGVDSLMLPMFLSYKEVREFIDIVDKRVNCILLLETIDAVNDLDNILKVTGISEIHIGLNDLSISMNMKFLFQPILVGVVDYIITKVREFDIPYGFGGIGSLGKGVIPSENLIIEHYRLGSSAVILSRSFNKDNDPSTFSLEVNKIRNQEVFASKLTIKEFSKNKAIIDDLILNYLKEK